MRTNAGTDFQAAQMGGTGSTATGSFIATTANVTAPSAADTTLTGEYVVAGSGLLRASATYAHSAGVASYTLSKTFTGTGSDTYPSTVGKIGVLTASSGGTLVFETLLTAVATLNAVGDSVAITETVSI